MSSTTLGLGKGLDALIRETTSPRGASGAQTLRLKDIVPNAQQPRQNFSPRALEELAASIAGQGLLQPILVRPLGEGQPGKYEIVAGERRWRASQMAGLTEVPVLIRNFTAQETLAAALIENLQREDLNPVEEALGIQKLKEEFALSQDDLAKMLGKSRSAIANALRLLTLPDYAQAALAEARLSPGQARALLSIPEPGAQQALFDRIQEQQLSVREAEGLAAFWKEQGGFPEIGEGAEGREPFPGPRRAGTGASRHPRPQSARLLDLQNRLNAALAVPVKCTGKESKGRISLHFRSKEELEQLLRRFGMDMDAF